MPSASVIPLLSSWEDYMLVDPQGDVQGFARWVLASQKPMPAPQTEDTTQGPLLIARLHRILHVLSKPVIKELGFAKDMEFTVLVHIAIMDKPNKKELGRELLIENSTGVEITRRLAGRGFITEKPDPDDRRSTRLTLTEKGKRTLLQGYEKLAHLHTSFLDALSHTQKKDFIQFLTLINKYHSATLSNTDNLLS